MKKNFLTNTLLSTIILTMSTFANAWSVSPANVAVLHDNQWESSSNFVFGNGIDVYELTRNNIDAVLVYLRTYQCALDQEEWRYWNPDTDTWGSDIDTSGGIVSGGMGNYLYGGGKWTNPIENESYQSNEPLMYIRWSPQGVYDSYGWRFDIM